MRWGDPEGEILDRDRDFGAIVWAERLIYLSPELRLKRNRGMAWTTFCHELLHARFPKMRHSKIAVIEGPMGEILAELLGAESTPRAR